MFGWDKIKWVFLFLFISMIPNLVYADRIGFLIEESDGSPAGYGIKLIVPNGSLGLSGGDATLTLAGGGDLLSTNNLSDLANDTTALNNLFAAGYTWGAVALDLSAATIVFGLEASDIPDLSATYLTAESDPTALLTAGTDNVKDTHIDWGSGAGQVDSSDIGALPSSGGTLTGELILDELGIEGQPTDAIVDCSSFAATGGGIFYDDSEGKWKKCQDNVLTDLDTDTGSGFAVTDITGQTDDTTPATTATAVLAQSGALIESTIQQIVDAALAAPAAVGSGTPAPGTFTTIGGGGGGFSVDADGDVTYKSAAAAKQSGVAGDYGLYEANSTDTHDAGRRGPDSITGDGAYRGKYANARASSANMVEAWTNVGETGTGTAADPYIQTVSFVDLDDYMLIASFDTWAEQPALTSAYILVGNGSNQPAAVAMSGDVAIDNTGATTIQAGSVDAAMLGTDADDDAIEFVIDGGGSAITTGLKGCVEVPYACTINSSTLVADQAGSIVLDIWVDSFANYQPTVADTITASAKPTLSTAISAQDSTLTGWTTSLSKGDWVCWNVDSASTVTWATNSLKVDK